MFLWLRMLTCCPLVSVIGDLPHCGMGSIWYVLGSHESLMLTCHSWWRSVSSFARSMIAEPTLGVTVATIGTVVMNTSNDSSFLSFVSGNCYTNEGQCLLLCTKRTNVGNSRRRQRVFNPLWKVFSTRFRRLWSSDCNVIME